MNYSLFQNEENILLKIWISFSFCAFPKLKI